MLGENRPNCHGRIYLAPTKLTEGNRSELWINIGNCVRRGQRYPNYIDILQVACSPEQYANLMMALQEVLQARALHPRAELGAQLMCACTAGCCFCPCLYVNQHLYKLNIILGEVVRVNTRGWSCRVHLEQVLVSSHIDAADEATDQFAVPLKVDGRHAVWPPPGYSVVISVQDSSIREKWAAPGGAVTHTAPRQVHMGRSRARSEERVNGGPDTVRTPAGPAASGSKTDLSTSALGSANVATEFSLQKLNWMEAV
mmetsp:Transcript_20049/g.36218  ORF Transcript_20049/g.36218 Transcript_20049/m.36218 type:complete len:256 (-) Transcript_20049:164-931(-)